MLKLLFLSLCFAQGVPEEVMTVRSSRLHEVYVEDPLIVNDSNYGILVDKNLIFGYTSVYKQYAKDDNGPIDGNLMVFNSDTISTAYEECDYNKDALKCSYENGHLLLRTFIHINGDQMIVQMALYDEYMQIVNHSVRTKIGITIYLIRQKITKTGGQNKKPTYISSGNCSGNRCEMPQRAPRRTVVEDLDPVKIIIHPRVLDRDIQQASMMLWTGAKL
jgi:hypothetical protein